jgi:soluble lytic murein transglycosylase-like protein
MRQIRLLPRTDEEKETVTSRAQPLAVIDAFSPGASSCPTTDLPGSFQSEPQLDFSSDPLATPIPTAKNTPLPLSHSISLSDFMQKTPGTTSSARPFVVIHADKKLKKTAPVADAPARHLKPRLRQIILLVAILLVFSITLFTLVPLSTGQNNFPLFSSLSSLIHSSQSSMEVQAHQTATAAVAQGVVHTQLNISHSQYVAIAEQDATNVGISPTYFVRQIQQESGFNPNAESPSGAVGIAQFMPSTAAGLGIDPWNPIQALQGAAKMMANAYHAYGDYAKALAAYNAGSANLNYAVSSCGANWLSCMPLQTQDYVATIMG